MYNRSPTKETEGKAMKGKKRKKRKISLPVIITILIHIIFITPTTLADPIYAVFTPTPKMEVIAVSKTIDSLAISSYGKILNEFTYKKEEIYTEILKEKCNNKVIVQKNYKPPQRKKGVDIWVIII